MDSKNTLSYKREVFCESDYSLRQISRLLSNQVTATPAALARLRAALNSLEQEKADQAEILALSLWSPA